MRTVAIDPGGAKGLAWSLLQGDRVFAAGLERVEAASAAGPKDPGALALAYAERLDVLRPDVVIVESMVHYAGSAGSRADRVVEDLLDLQAIGATVAGYLRPQTIRFVPARQWKGQVPKTVTQKRASETLDATERQVVQLGLGGVPKGLHNDVWDAVALGLWSVRRYR